MSWNENVCWDFWFPGSVNPAHSLKLQRRRMTLLLPIRICLTQDVPRFSNSTPPLQLGLVEAPQQCFVLIYLVRQSKLCFNIGEETGILLRFLRYSKPQEVRVHAARAAAEHKKNVISLHLKLQKHIMAAHTAECTACRPPQKQMEGHRSPFLPCGHLQLISYCYQRTGLTTKQHISATKYRSGCLWVTLIKHY